MPKKLNITTIFNTNEDVQKATQNTNLQYNCSSKRLQEYESLLKNNVVDIEKLKQSAWNGIPFCTSSLT